MTYRLDGDHVIDQTINPAGRYYLREIVDPYCSEYTASILTDDQRRAIFETIGAAALADALGRLYAADRSFDDGEATQTVRLAQWRLYSADLAS